MNNKEKPSSVLIVDDNIKNLQVLADILRDKNYKVAMAKDGSKALAFINKIQPDLILLDIMMPEMDGFEVCRRLKNNDDTKEIPIIFISALSDTADKVRGFEVGGVDYITKPFQKEEVFARVHAHLELKRSHEKLKKINYKLQEANKEITDSIQYAHFIQRSLLPDQNKIKYYLPDSFFIWMPKEVIGGDIFFAEFFSSPQLRDAKKGCFIIAVIDCTGHGVPGAFMTMIASSALKRIISDEGCHDPALILKRLNFIVKTTLHQDTEYAVSDDGMDAAIVSFEYPLLTFAGAKMPLFYTLDGELTVVKGDKQSIGYKRSDLNFNFTNHIIPMKKGISLYMASDGFEDQLGKDDQSRFNFSRFGRERLMYLISEVSRLPFEEQEKMILETFHRHRGDKEIQDDVTVVGFRPPLY